MALDTRWKNPQGPTNELMYLWAQDLIKELRKGDYLDAVSTVPADGSITNAKLADMVQATIKGRASGAGTGVPQDLTGTQATVILDNFVGDSGSGGTKGLVPAPASGDAAAVKFLKATGVWSALPSTSGGITTIASGSFPAATVLDVTSIPATYAYIIAHFVGASSNTATRSPQLQVSTNNGSSYDTAVASYFPDGTVATLLTGTPTPAANTHFASLMLLGYQAGSYTVCTGPYGNSNGPLVNIQNSVYVGSTNAINALRFLWNASGNFDAGTYAVYGVS